MASWANKKATNHCFSLWKLQKTPIKIHQWDQQCGVIWPREKWLMHQSLSNSQHTRQKWTNPVLARLNCLPSPNPEELKSQKVKAFKPKKIKKNRWKRKKHRRNFIKKVVVWAFFYRRYRRGKQIEEIKKIVFQKIERILWEKKAEERQCCLQHACVIPQHLCIF